jgi:hypothetical protein
MGHMRKILVMITMGTLISASAAVAMGTAAPAGVQAVSCTYTVEPTTLPAAGTVVVSGVAPGSTQVEVQVDGVTVATVQSAPVTGVWGPVTIQINATSVVSIALSENYATLPCVGNAGTEVVKITVGGSAASLPRTGSSGTGTMVRIALVVIGVGLVLVVGAGRRRRVRA